MFITFHADDINSVIMYKYIFRKAEGDSVDKPVCDTRTNFCVIYCVFNPSVMPLLRFCMKANMCKNEYLEILKIILCFPLCAKNKR